MSVQDQDEGTRTAFAVLIPLLVLVVGFVVGLGIHKAKRPAPKPEAPVAAVVAEADASVVVENGVVKFYFASGKAELAAGAADALAEVVKAAAGGKTLVVSGFHDATGNAEFNAELAKQRALAVRGALTAAGVAETSIELKKPEQLTGSGTDAQARRVEVMAQ